MSIIARRRNPQQNTHTCCHITTIGDRIRRKQKGGVKSCCISISLTWIYVFLICIDCYQSIAISGFIFPLFARYISFLMLYARWVCKWGVAWKNCSHFHCLGAEDATDRRSDFSLTNRPFIACFLCFYSSNLRFADVLSISQQALQK